MGWTPASRREVDCKCGQGSYHTGPWEDRNVGLQGARRGHVQVPSRRVVSGTQPDLEVVGGSPVSALASLNDGSRVETSSQRVWAMARTEVCHHGLESPSQEAVNGVRYEDAPHP